jgi:hypothetical protein
MPCVINENRCQQKNNPIITAAMSAYSERTSCGIWKEKSGSITLLGTKNAISTGPDNEGKIKLTIPYVANATRPLEQKIAKST